MKHHGKHHPHHAQNRGMAAHIMRDKDTEPAGMIGGPKMEADDRARMAAMRAPQGPARSPMSAGPPPGAPAGPPPGFGMAPGAGGGPLPPEEGGGL